MKYTVWFGAHCLQPQKSTVTWTPGWVWCVPWWPVSIQDSSSKKEIFLNAPIVGANLEKREGCGMLCWFVLLAEPCWGQVLPAANCGFVAGQAEGCAAGLVPMGGAAARLLHPDNAAEVKGALPICAEHCWKSCWRNHWCSRFLLLLTPDR